MKTINDLGGKLQQRLLHTLYDNAYKFVHQNYPTEN